MTISGRQPVTYGPYFAASFGWYSQATISSSLRVTFSLCFEQLYHLHLSHYWQGVSLDCFVPLSFGLPVSVLCRVSPGTSLEPAFYCWPERTFLSIFAKIRPECFTYSNSPN